MEKLLNKEWRMQYLYKIRNKEGKRIAFKMNRAQQDFNSKKHSRNIILKSRQLGMCLTEEMRVLTAELQWCPIKDIERGTKIICVEEDTYKRGKGRKMFTGVVEEKRFMEAEAFRIHFDDGRFVECTENHPWLTKKTATDLKWRKLQGGGIKEGTYVRWITKPWGKSTFEDGWIGGMLDGEGSMSKPSAKKSADLNCSQVSGKVLDRLKKYFDKEGYSYRLEIDKRKSGETSKLGDKQVTKICVGRMNEIFKLIGKTRPERFLGEKRYFWEGRQMPGKKTGIGLAKVIKIESIGKRTVVDLQTSGKTYIAEGFVSHNTTFQSIDILDDVLFGVKHNGERMAIDAVQIAHTDKEAIKIFQNKVNFAWENIPQQIRDLWKTTTDKANELKFDWGDGQFSSMAVTNSGRSGTYQRVHVSEFGKLCRLYPQKAEEMLTGTLPAVPFDGRVDIESTAEGEFGSFHDMFWEAWLRGEPEFVADYKSHFYNWTWDDDEIAKIDEEIINKFKHSEDRFPFLDLQKKYNFTDQQITYYFTRWISLSRKWYRLRQEYPITPEEAFISSGSKLFDKEELEKMEIIEPKKIGDWRIYEEYIVGQKYVMGADVAEGVGQDSSTAVVLRLGKTAKVVAVYWSRDIPPDLFAHELKRMAVNYGGCLVCPERNNHGHTTISKLKEIYSNVYKDVNPEREFEYRTGENKKSMIMKYGWLTTKTSKPHMLNELREAINNEEIEIPCKELLFELRTYDREDLGVVKFDAQATNHWDLVLALSISYQMRTKNSLSNFVRPTYGLNIPQFSRPLYFDK